MPGDCEWGVLMHRLPAARMLDALLQHGHVPPDLSDQLAARLIPFHAGVPQCASQGGARESASLAAAVITENLDQLEPFAGAPLGRTELRLVSEAMREFVTAEAHLLERRAADGWIREGHGDLRAEHVCLEGGRVQVFDCVEFSREIRCADVASDLAFLLMDLTRLGYGMVADDLIERYRAAGFDLPDVVLRYYHVHRALVRAKVACMERAGVEGDAARRYTDEAGDYLNMATAQALKVRPALYLMTGLSGTGKSTVAGAIARACNVPVVASDAVRKELAGRSGPAPADWGQGIYAAEWTARTYARLRVLARQRLLAGEGVVVDATFLDAEERTRFAGEAAAAGTPAILVETVCDLETALARIRARAARGGSNSDAHEAIYLRQRQVLAENPLGIPPGAVGVTIDTNDDQPGRLDPLFAALAERGMIESALISGVVAR
jgi:aminoglycoside phosphotransferase family enzyme/predicted kinase